ncbi:MAG: DNA adenine methylase [Candidatus Obscuribacterales bacterium]|nr:DNA adenine methylase [Candidatus Obscuribacterales bacterium]
MNKAVKSRAGLTAPHVALLLPCKPYRSPLRYPGGKQKAIDRISELLPQKMQEYREPMLGGGSVYLHARSQGLAKKYWVNDKFHELVQFWQAVQDPHTCEKLADELELLRAGFSSPEQIKEYFLKARNEEPLDSYRKALLFFFFNRVTFSGTTRAGGFSSSASLRRFTASSIERLRPLPEALSGTKITELDFEELIKAPGKDVFIFLDPPYYTASRLYGKNGSLHEFDHERLALALKKCGHKFLITYDDCPELRKLYKWANIKEWQLQYGMNNCNLQRESKIGSELFVMNY